MALTHSNDDTVELVARSRVKLRILWICILALTISISIFALYVSFQNAAKGKDQEAAGKQSAQAQSSQNASAANQNKNAADKLCDQIKALGRTCVVNPQTLPTPVTPVPGRAGEAGKPGANSTVQGPSGAPGPAGSSVKGDKGDPGEDGIDPACLQQGQGNCIGPSGKPGPSGPVGGAGPSGPAGSPCPEGMSLQPEVQLSGNTAYVCEATPTPTPTDTVGGGILPRTSTGMNSISFAYAGVGVIGVIVPSGWIYLWYRRKREDTPFARRRRIA